MTPIKFKENCRFKTWSPALHWIFTVLKELCRDGDNLPSELVITSVNDSVHKVGSRHYTDEATDIRSKNFSTMAAKTGFARLLQAQLNAHPLESNRFVVLLESVGTQNEHFHVQVKKNARFTGV